MCFLWGLRVRVKYAETSTSSMTPCLQSCRPLHIQPSCLASRKLIC